MIDPITDPDFAAALVLDSVLSGGWTSMLQSELRERRGLVYNIGSQLMALSREGRLMIDIDTSPHTVQECLHATKRVITRVTEHAPTSTSLARAKAACHARLAFRWETSDMLIQDLVDDELAGHHLAPDTFLADIGEVTASDVHRVAQRLLGQPLATVIASPQAPTPTGR